MSSNDNPFIRIRYGACSRKGYLPLAVGKNSSFKAEDLCDGGAAGIPMGFLTKPASGPRGPYLESSIKRKL